MVKIRHQITLKKFKKEESAEITKKIMKTLPAIIEKYKTKLNSKNSEEIARRISVLNNEFISYCVRLVNEMFLKMNFTVSAAETLTHIRKLMIRNLTIVPDFEPINCVLVRQRIVEYISKMMIDIKNEQLKSIRNKRKRIKTLAASKIHSTVDENVRRVHVAFAVPEDIFELQTTIKFAIEEPVKKKSFKEKLKIDKIVRKFFEQK